MPLQFDDAAHAAASHRSTRDRAAAIFEAIRSRLMGVDGRDKLKLLIDDLDAHRDTLVSAIDGTHEAALQAPIIANTGRLGPGETPFAPGDTEVSLVDSERQGNPAAPIDASGHKVHSSDAAALAAGRGVNPAGGQGFGGNGMTTQAAIRTAAAVGAAGDRAVAEKTLQERGIVDEYGRSETGGGKTELNVGGKVPVVSNDIVPGSEHERDGVKYVTKRDIIGKEYEAVDTRQPNGPRS